MHARVSTYSGPADRVDDFTSSIDRVTDELRRMDGFQGAYGLVDRSSGRAMTITFWESEQAVQASVEAANRLRSNVAEGSGQTIQSVETYEVIATID